MTKQYNPFMPNCPVYTGMFVGRLNEITRIDKVLFQTKNSNPTNIAIVGERGIGKSSLLLVTKFFALGEISFEDDKYNFLTVDLSIDNKTTLIDLAGKIKLGIERELNTNEQLLAVIKKAWEFCKNIQVKGFGYTEKDKICTSSEFIDKFIYSLVDTIKTITKNDSSAPDLHCKKDGLVILIDEADNASRNLNLGGFLKLLSEKLVSEGCNRVLIILAGLPRLHNILYKSHSSSLRMFEELEIATLSNDEVKEVIQRGLKEAYEKNNIKITIDNTALDLIATYSEGYPHFVQQIGYSVLEVDDDNNITKEDVTTAMFKEGGALDLIGDRYYKNLYYEKIKDRTYREILQIMADKWDGWTTKKEIKAKFSDSTTKLDNGLFALIQRNIILPKKGTRGVYRLQWRSFAFWIKNYTHVEITATNNNRK